MTSDLSMEAAMAHSEWSAANRILKKLRRRAGRAIHNYDTVYRELEEEIDTFAGVDWSGLSLLEVAQVAGRIQAKARSLLAATEIPAQAERVAAARLKLNAAVKARDDERNT